MYGNTKNVSLYFISPITEFGNGDFFLLSIEKKHKLKFENYVLFSGFSKDLNPEDNPSSDDSEELLKEVWEELEYVVLLQKPGSWNVKDDYQLKKTR